MELKPKFMGLIREQGGWRENNVLDNLKSYSYSYAKGYRIITFTDNNGRSCDYSLAQSRWIG